METLPHAWQSGPISDKELTPPHGRPILAMTTFNDTVITASADHGLRIYNTNTGSHMRQLYNKHYGHKEWVSCLDVTRDGREKAQLSPLCSKYSNLAHFEDLTPRFYCHGIRRAFAASCPTPKLLVPLSRYWKSQSFLRWSLWKVIDGQDCRH